MKKRHATAVLFVIFFLTMALQAAEAKPKYVGSKKCGGCHKSEQLAWQVSIHAKAFDLLKPGKRKKAKKRAELDPEKDYTADKKCVKCHVTGYGEKGGYKDIKSTPNMLGVGCESCHGPGSKYVILHDEKMYGFGRSEAKALGQTYGSEDESVCIKCHGDKDSPFHEKIDPKYKFDWKAALAKRKTFHPKKKKSSFAF
ncbi:MAG TPA: cytochrome C554 [Sedimenticola sp.]|nr:cytochrome C554 [Sedimenticola sp.]